MTQEQINLIIRGIKDGVQPHKFPLNELANHLYFYSISPNEYRDTCYRDYLFLLDYYKEGKNAKY